MKRTFFSLLVIVLIVGLSDAVIYACGAKFLVSGRTNSPAMIAARENTEPTTLLVYWQQDDQTEDEDKWSDRATEFLEDVGHTVTVTFDSDSFLAAARDGDFEVLVVKPIGEARRLKDEVAAVAPDAVVMPILYLAQRKVVNAAKQEFERVLAMPMLLEDFLYEIDQGGRAR